MKTTISITIAALCLSLSAGAQESFRADSLVNCPWQEQKTVLSATGSMRSAGEKELEKTPVQDLRRKLIGVFPGLISIENLPSYAPSGDALSPYISCNEVSLVTRGIGTIACIVDDVPVPFNQYLLDPVQIESVTFVSDVADRGSMGPVSSYSALYFKTKKGSYNTPMRITFDIESGVDVVGLCPEWVDGTTYALLNNQAREAAGYRSLYSEEDIAGFAKNDPYDMKTPNVDYRSLMSRNCKPVTRVAFNANAGSNNVKYNVSLSGLNDNSLFTVGPKCDFNKINMSSSVTARIGSYIEANASFMGNIRITRSMTGASWASMFGTPAVAFPLFLTVAEDNPMYDPEIMSNSNQIYGVSRTFPNNPYAAAVEGGSTTSYGRSGMLNASVDIDFSWLLKGLKSKTFASLSTYYARSPGMVEDYIGYFWNSTDIIEALSTHTGIKASSKTDRSSASYQCMNLYERLTYGIKKGRSKLDLSGTYYMCAADQSAYSQRQLFTVWNADYSWSERYFISIVGQYAGTGRYAKGSRFRFFPSAGASWVVSNENWLKDSTVLTYLKLNAQIGRDSDGDIYSSSQYYWQGQYAFSGTRHYGPESANQWFGSQHEDYDTAVLVRIPNYGLTWPVLEEIDFGLDLSLFNCLDLHAHYHDMDRSGIITETAAEYAASFGYSGVALYENFNCVNYHGYDLSAQYHKSFKDFSFNIGAQESHWDIIYKKQANNVYLYDYQNIEGRSYYDVTGYHYLGKFASEEDLASYPVYSYNTQVGDLKYEDKNADGIIDSNDVYVIGNRNPALYYTLNLDLQWKKIDLSIVGTGTVASTIVVSNNYFWGGWGDGVYSKFMAENIGGDYPRLSYNKIDGNFLTSEFWFRKADYFKIKSAELGYTATFPESRFIKQMKVSLRGANLLTITPLKYIDPESPMAGLSSMPLMKTITVGAKLNF